MKLLLFLTLIVTVVFSRSDNSVQCEICEKIVEYVYKFVAEGKTESEIVKSLELVCDVLPKDYKATCDEIVEQYIPTIITFVEHEAPPKKICQMILMCPKETPFTHPAPVAADDCMLCKFLVQLTVGLEEQGKTEDQIKSDLLKACKLLPKPSESECEKVARQDVGKIIQYVKDKKTPEDICHLLGLCPENEDL